ncbi:hypothetical protein ABT369_11830 [Dactylosporangium sp. NPDC000244]|uniref:hypothetical protein n=1 Tax=Dactylosporangium sp. NPDC000244 TaxID=3154365 RepID=UPI00332F1139
MNDAKLTSDPAPPGAVAPDRPWLPIPWLVAHAGVVGVGRIPAPGLHALPYFGPLFVCASESPQLIGVDRAVALPAAAALAMMIGALVGHLNNPDRWVQQRRFKVTNRVARLLGGIATMLGIMATLPGPYWSVLIVVVPAALQELLHRVSRRRRRSERPSCGCGHVCHPASADVSAGDVIADAKPGPGTGERRDWPTSKARRNVSNAPALPELQ